MHKSLLVSKNISIFCCELSPMPVVIFELISKTSDTISGVVVIFYLWEHIHGNNETDKLKSKKTDMLRSNSKQYGKSI